MPTATVTPANFAERLSIAETESKALYLRGLQSVSEPLYKRLSTPVSMSTATMSCPIAGMVGPLREWTGPRQVENLQRTAYAITAKKFEKTLGIPREAFEDDTQGTWIAQLETLGLQVGAWPDQQCAAKLAAGGVDLCYDGKPFFASDHPVELGNVDAGVFSNTTGTGSPAWYLLDLSKGIMPLVWALRTSPEFVQNWSPNDPNVFWKDEFVTGVRARGVADYGFPQLIHRCGNALNSANYEAAVLEMTERVNGAGENLNVHPTLLVVPPALKGAAQRLFERQFVGNSDGAAENNVYYKDVEWAVWQRLPKTAVV